MSSQAACVLPETGSAEPTDPDLLDHTVADVARTLMTMQEPDGHWRFELEADATIPAEYILLEHFLGEIDPEMEERLARYLRKIQGEDGGWPLFHGGEANISATVKAYYALKLVGDDPDAPHMVRARGAVLARGGAARANVFTRSALALFGQVPWRAVPVMPVEIMLLPRWSPFHLSKVSYWSRTVIAPLLILMSLKPKALNPRGIGIPELFVTPPEEEQTYLVNPTGEILGQAFLWLDQGLRLVEPLMGAWPLRQRAIAEAVSFITERLNGEEGLGAIFPAMANAVMAFAILGRGPDDPDRAIAMASIKKLLAHHQEYSYCEPCLSPIWDTGLALHALMEASQPGAEVCVARGVDWLLDRQVLDVVGDWGTRRPNLRPGGWPFQYRNDHYPDTDDTAVVAMALHRTGRLNGDGRIKHAIDRAAEWTIGMQSRNGGWAAFDADNLHFYLNHIPFADHGALLDPPTVDVSARCIGFLAQLGHGRDHPAIKEGLAYLHREQEKDGSWFGRWGTNYIYGTWSALAAFNAVGDDPGAPHIRKAVDWLLAHQRQDGGWGEDGTSYWDDQKAVAKASTPSQTAWALLGLMAAGEVENEAVKRGIDYLLAAPRQGARWEEPWYTAVGFPRVFYLRYHGYAAYFPLWALARYRNLLRANSRRVPHGL